MNTFDAMFSRKSNRHFKHEKLEWDVISEILEYANKLPMLMEDIAVEFKLVNHIEEKQGFSTPFHVKAPYYLCISSEDREGYLLNAGYLMQQMDLFLATKGLGACYSILSPGKSLKDTMKYKFVIALAFGITSSPVVRDSSDARRFPESELVVYKEEVSADIKQILSAARLAPSLYNSQPWRFVVYNNRIHIFAKKNLLIGKLLDYNKMIDMGIMLANLLLAAEELWIDVSLTISENLKNKQFQKNEYVCTIAIA
ncbi:MAG: nitroreductase family protein [Mobilitalea sp.]